MRTRQWGPQAACMALAALVAGTFALIGATGITSPAGAETISTLPTGFGGIVVDPSTDRVFVSSPSSGTVTALDFAGQIVGSASGLAGPESMVVSGSTLYVALHDGGAIAELDTASLAQIGSLGTGSLVAPGPLVMASGLLWTSTGVCGQWTTRLASVDPTTGVVTTYSMPSSTNLGYCIDLAASPQLPKTLLAWDLGLDPATISRLDVSTGVPVLGATATEQDQANLQQIAVNPDGTTFVTASGSPYTLEEFRISDLGLDGVSYPANPYPDAIATTGARGGLVIGGMNGAYGPDLIAYATGAPGTTLYSHDFASSTNTVVPGGLALSPDGSSVFAVTGSSGSSGTTWFSRLPLANSTATTVSAPSTARPGSPVTFTASVDVAAGGFSAPTGVVSFAVDGNEVGSATLDASGQAMLSVDNLTNGAHTVTASYGGDGNNIVSVSTPTSFAVGYSTTTTLTSSANPAMVGQPVTFTASVAGGQAETGTVTFAESSGNGSVTLAAVPLESDGTASYTTSSLTAGSHSITANYGGDGTNAASTGSLTEQIDAYATTTSVSALPDSVHAGDSVTLSATVAPSAGSPSMPTGTVTFSTADGLIGSAPLSSSGTASISTSALSVGTDGIVGTYSGDAVNASSYGTTSVAVAADATSTSLVASINPSEVGQEVSFTATVSGSGSYPPTGFVLFSEDGETLGSAELSQSGTASVTTSSLTPGSHGIVATYGGDSENGASTSPTLEQDVQQATSTTALSSSGPAQVGQPATLTASVAGYHPSGNVTFYDGSTGIGSASVSTTGVATLTCTFTSAGTHLITAVYSGDTNNNASNASTTQPINPDASVTVVSSSANPIKPRTSLTLTATVTANPGGASPSGTVTFYLNGKTLGLAVTLQVDGPATTIAAGTVSSLPKGTDAIVASYSSGTSDVASSSSSVFYETVR